MSKHRTEIIFHSKVKTQDHLQIGICVRLKTYKRTQLRGISENQIFDPKKDYQQTESTVKIKSC